MSPEVRMELAALTVAQALERLRAKGLITAAPVALTPKAEVMLEAAHGFSPTQQEIEAVLETGLFSKFPGKQKPAILWLVRREITPDLELPRPSRTR